MPITSDIAVEHRRPEHDVDSLFIHRWSPRAMSGETVTKEELMSLFEAARWAPSSFNNQPWRFIYALRDSKYWKVFLDLLESFNQSWAKNAGALIVVASKLTFDSGKPSRTHAFDAGSAWGNLALEGSLKGLAVHGMEGFAYERAHKVLELPQDYQVEAMIAVGRPGRKEDLPEKLQEREFPSKRKPISEIAFEGKFNESRRRPHER